MPPKKQDQKELEQPMSEELSAKIIALADSGYSYIRIDPETKKPWPEAKEFIWKINHVFDSTVQHGAGSRTMLQIVKLYRHKFTEVEQRTSDGKDVIKVKKHQSFNVMKKNKLGQIELYASGDRLIDGELFLKEFGIDKQVKPEMDLMAEVSADESGEPAAA